MNKKTYQLDIAEPCSESWNDMTPNRQGRHCAKCAKTVIDFTRQSNRQIIERIKEANGQICGRLPANMLNTDITLDTEFLRKTKWKTFGLMLTSLLGTATGFAQNNPPEPPVLTSQMMLGEIDHQYMEAPKKGVIFQTINGIVQSELKGVPNVKVGVEGTSYSVMTVENGRFSIKFPKKEKPVLLVFYAFGHETKYVQIDPTHRENQLITISLKATQKTKEIAVISKPIFFNRVRTTTTGRINIIPPNKLKSKLINWRAIRKKRKAKKALEPTTPEIVTIEGAQKQNSTIIGTPNWIQSVYPIPFDNQITIEIKSETEENLNLVLFDDLGRELKRKEVFALQGITVFTMKLDGFKISNGNYFISAFRSGEVLQTMLLVKGDNK